MNRRIERKWIASLAKEVTRKLDSSLSSDLWTKGGNPSKACVETNSDGWLYELGSVRGDRGSQLELWLDRWTGGEEPRLCYCYRSTSSERVAAMSRSGTGKLGVAKRFKDSYDWRSDDSGYSVMKSPLDSSLFGKPIAELTERDGYWSFFGVYERRTPPLRAAPALAMVERVGDFLASVALASSALSQTERAELPFPEERNRKYVKSHIASERNRALASRVKLRDSYTCRVCAVNFESRYGSLGRRYAEAHHVRPLGRVRVGTRIVSDDLITVCANCHRMLHRMSGKNDDWIRLREIVRRNSR